MRTTSKIILGGYIFITISALIYIIVQSRIPKVQMLDFSLANDRIETKELPPFSIFKLIYTQENRVENGIYLGPTTFTITQSETGVSNFGVSEIFGKSVLFETIGDTLLCKISLPETINKEIKSNTMYQLQNLHCNLSLPKGSSLFVYNRAKDFITNIENVELENLSLESINSVNVNSSDITNFTCSTGESQCVYVINTTIQNYNLDLDDLISWNIKESRIGKLNLSSDKQIRITSIPYAMCDEVTYTPKNEKASLNIKLTSPTTLLYSPLFRQ